MSDGVLLHLTTPAEWRDAMRTGALVPPSLAEVGFVHLSAPGQVHLPAAALFAGRRDVVVLVVDPARVGAPVRLEPGVPADPAGMRFPHLYGPLPAAAVVAVLPWRADRPLLPPDPDDAGGRPRALAVSLPLRRAATVVDLPVGFAVSDPAVRHSRDHNRVIVTGPADADTVVAATGRAAGEARWAEPAATLLYPAAAPVADELARRGWEVSPWVVMARRAAGGVLPAGGGGPAVEVVADLTGRERRDDRVVRVVDLAVRDGGRVVAAGELRIDGATAVLDPVPTGATGHRRASADAVLRRAVELAGEAGCDLVVVDAAAQDRSQQWYARRGLVPVGRRWDLVRP
ncbi:DUF952 domain-containing protein [Modestobacter sp. URMC 112]